MLWIEKMRLCAPVQCPKTAAEAPLADRGHGHRVNTKITEEVATVSGAIMTRETEISRVIVKETTMITHVTMKGEVTTVHGPWKTEIGRVIVKETTMITHVTMKGEVTTVHVTR